MNDVQHILNLLMQNNSAMQNPIIANAYQLYKSGDTKGLQTIAENMCRERGINPNDLLNTFAKR